MQKTIYYDYSEYFNTNNETGKTLSESRNKCNQQEKQVLSIFIAAKVTASPEWVHGQYCKRYGNVPLTSIRRAITCLTKKGLLEKTETMVLSQYGKKTHTWRLIG